MQRWIVIGGLLWMAGCGAAPEPPELEIREVGVRYEGPGVLSRVAFSWEGVWVSVGSLPGELQVTVARVPKSPIQVKWIDEAGELHCGEVVVASPLPELPAGSTGVLILEIKASWEVRAWLRAWDPDDASLWFPPSFDVTASTRAVSCSRTGDS